MEDLSYISIFIACGMIVTLLFQDCDVRRPQESNIKTKATESYSMKIVNKIIIPLCLLARILLFGYSITTGRVDNIWPLSHIWTDVLCVGLFMLAFSLRRKCKRRLEKWFTHLLAVQTDQRLVTTGPYSFVRHPSYAALIIMVVVCGYTTCDLWGILFALFVIIYIRDRIHIEEKMMMEIFKTEWIKYCQCVDCKLIPCVY